MPGRSRPLAGLRILVVEDEYLIASEVRRWLIEAGATVVGPVPSAEQALGLIADHRLDAALLDIDLGEGHKSYPIADKLGAIGVPYLFASSDTQVRDANGYRDRPLLDKPFLENEVTRALLAVKRDRT